MKAIGIMIIMLAMLVVCGTAPAEETKVSGEVSVTGVLRDGKDQDAKFNEYRDIRDGVQTDIQLKVDSPRAHALFEAKNILYRDQKYSLEGGMWDIFSIKVYYDEIPHNYTYDARSFYTGIGTSNLTYSGTPPSSNANSWNTFDYSVKRKHIGGDLKFDLLNPFYVDVFVDQQKKYGLYPLAVAGTSPGGMGIELPVNIDYTTDNIKLEAGYSTKPFFVSASYTYSRLQNGDGYQNFRNPATVNTRAVTDTLFLPPENDYVKYDVKGAVALPFNSKINADLSTSRARSTSHLTSRYVADVSAAGPTPPAISNIGIQGLTGLTLSSPTFNGHVTTDQLNLALTTNPKPFINAKLYYKYYNKDNKSDLVTTTDTQLTTPPQTFTNSLFDYRKNTYGVEGALKLPADFRLNAGYSFTKTERAREDIPKNRDNLFDVGLKWSGLKFLNAKVGYEHLDRAAEFNVPVSATPVDWEAWVKRFDAGPQTRNTYKASLEFFPIDALSINLGYKYKNSNYNETQLGLQETKAHEFNTDIDWLVHERVRLFGHFDLERRLQKQFQRQATAYTTPYTTPISTAYNWTADATEYTLGYGIGADITIITDKLKLQLTHNFVKSDGVVDYTYLVSPATLAALVPAGQNQDNIDLNAWDNYRLSNIVVKATYQVTKMVGVSAAYAYEEYSYDDTQYRLYSYVPGSTGYMTGAYNNDSYRTHVVFMGVNVKF